MKALLVFLLHLCSLVTVISADGFPAGDQSQFFEEDHKTMHMTKALAVHCPLDLLSPQDHRDCVNVTHHSIRSFKLSAFYYHKQDLLNKAAESAAGAADYEEFRRSESSLIAYHSKLSIAQDIADHHRMQRICLIGLRGGLALVNFLVANPTAQMVIFDPITNAHTLRHFQLIQQAHPQRVISLFAGDLAHSLRSYLHFQNKCNLLFFDHNFPLSSTTSMSSIAGILESALHLVDPVFNRIVINDFELPVMSTALQYVFQKIRTNLICPTCTQPASSQPAASSESQCASRYATNMTMLAYYKGFLPTPCVVMYANDTNGRKMEFLFSMEHCIKTDTPVMEVDENVELVVLQMTHNIVDPDREHEEQAFS